jgi:glycosyltransferase involved in cell wall biosynthesis
MVELTLVYPYYNNPRCLERQLELWTRSPKELNRRIEYLLVDDGSAEPARVEDQPPLNLTLVRIKEDKPWNQHAARNLGMKLAEGEWAVASDIDHLFPAEGLGRVLSMPKEPGSVYYFGRRREDGTPKHSHPNSFLVNRGTFWKVGGYDEDFCGHYGKGDIFLRLLFARSCRIVQLEEPALIELDNAATPGLIRKTRHNRWLSKRKRWLLERGRYRNGRTLRFEWEIVDRWRTGSS